MQTTIDQTWLLGRAGVVVWVWGLAPSEAAVHRARAWIERLDGDSPALGIELHPGCGVPSPATRQALLNWRQLVRAVAIVAQAQDLRLRLAQAVVSGMSVVNRGVPLRMHSDLPSACRFLAAASAAAPAHPLTPSELLALWPQAREVAGVKPGATR